VRKLQGLVARGGAHRGVADGGGARPESTRESGLPVAGGGGPGAGSDGEARALKRRSRRGVETGERVGAVALERRGREGKKREGGVQLRKCHVARDGVVGPGPDWRVAPRPCPSRPRPGCDARGRRVAVRIAARWRGWAPVAVRKGRCRWHAGARGPAREESGVAESR
jgi:hypothetical protein